MNNPETPRDELYERKVELDNIWAYQDELYGLGNFINLTPTLKLLADYIKRPVPVYFDLKFIEECFLDCEFIDILKDKPGERTPITSGLINVRNNCPDWLHVYKEVTKRYPLHGEIPHTYVDQAKEIDAPKYNTVFIRGSGSEDPYYCAMKMPDDEYYKEYFNEYLNGLYTEAFTGSEGDVTRSNGLFKGMTCYTGGIRLALALIREADYVVANDSGLAHAAAAMHKPMTILWKNTALPKNANPNYRCKYKMCH
jgi:hypothetical protein